MAIDVKGLIEKLRGSGSSDDAIKSILLNMGEDRAQIEEALKAETPLETKAEGASSENISSAPDSSEVKLESANVDAQQVSQREPGQVISEVMNKNNPVFQKKIGIVAIGASVFLLVGGLAYAYVNEILFFAPKISGEQLFAGIPSALSKINSEKYAVVLNVESKPREAGALAYTEVPFPQYEAMKDGYDKDYRSIAGSATLLRVIANYKLAKKALPSSLDELSKYGAEAYSDWLKYAGPYSDWLQYKDSYEYVPSEPIKGGYNAFVLNINLNTEEAARAVVDYYATRLTYDKSETDNKFTPDISGKTVIYDSKKMSASDYTVDIYIPSFALKPRIMEFFSGFTDMAESLPTSMVVNLKNFGTVGFAETKTPDTSSGFSADLSFGDFSASIDIGLAKKDENYYIKINKMPALFIDFTAIKGKWVKITPEDLKATAGDFINPETLTITMDSSDVERQQVLEVVKSVYQMAITDGVLVPTLVKKEKTDPENSAHFKVSIAKEKINTFYEKMVVEVNSKMGEGTAYPLSELEKQYLESESFSNLFNYVKENNSLDIWVDKKEGYPVKFGYSLRLIPSDSNVKAKNIEYVLTADLDLTDINKAIQIDAPADTISFEDAFSLVTGESAPVLQSQADDYARISDLATMTSAISLYRADVMNPFMCEKGKIYKSNSGTTAVDGTGWLPINFEKISSGAPIRELYVDPINDDEFYYSYACNPTDGSYELNAIFAGESYAEKSVNDGGDNPNIYEVGGNLKIIH